MAIVSEEGNKRFSLPEECKPNKLHLSFDSWTKYFDTSWGRLTYDPTLILWFNSPKNFFHDHINQ